MQTPLALIAELTHRCPLHCVYCSNPLELTRGDSELLTEVWARVFREAAELGVLQADFTGGEPLARPDLSQLVRVARAARLYVSLITSGLPLDEKRLEDLVQAGVDHIQVSFQGAREESSIEFACARVFAQKLRVTEWIKRHHIALTLNFVIHRQNLDQLEEMLALAEQIGPGRVEFAHVQYYGWAFSNRRSLLPARAQLDRSLEFLKKAEERLRGRIRVEYVVPDYYAKYPKACMGGWGRKLMLITPRGDVLPCHAAASLPDVKFENVVKKSLRTIWHESPSFQKFRGEEWMPEPCRSCDRRSLDFGGCRCQALRLANDAVVTDPVCSLAPQRHIVDEILADVNAPPTMPVIAGEPTKIEWIYRSDVNTSSSKHSPLHSSFAGKPRGRTRAQANRDILINIRARGIMPIHETGPARDFIRRTETIVNLASHDSHRRRTRFYCDSPDAFAFDFAVDSLDFAGTRADNARRGRGSRCERFFRSGRTGRTACENLLGDRFHQHIGRFSFENVPATSGTLVITAKGFQQVQEGWSAVIGSRTAETYDAQARGLNRKFRLSRLGIPWGSPQQTCLRFSEQEV